MDRSERIGLGVSATAHGLVIAALALGLFHWSAPKVALPPSFEVALTDNIALESRVTSHEEARTAQAPELGASDPDATPPPEETVTEPEPEPAPVPKPTAQPAPRPEPAKKTPAKPEPTKTEKAKAEPAKTAPAKAQPEKEKPRRAGMLGAVLSGLDAPARSDSTSASTSGSAPLGAEAARALSAELRRQLKPFWRAPTGVDADKLVTTLRWRLNPDGTLASGPTLVEQTGKTASNRPQQQLHAEAAARAVRAAAPFRLPDDYYESWKLIEFSFDKRL